MGRPDEIVVIVMRQNEFRFTLEGVGVEVFVLIEFLQSLALHLHYCMIMKLKCKFIKSKN